MKTTQPTNKLFTHTPLPPSLPTQMLQPKPETPVSPSKPEFMHEDATTEAEQTPTQAPRSPFWIQPNNLTHLQRFSSLFFNSFVLIIFLLVFAVISLVFIIPNLVNLSSNVFGSNLVKRSWDSINLMLVCIALVFGFLSRNIGNDEKLDFDNGYDRRETEEPAGAPIMYGFQDETMDSAIGLSRQRTSISYPDLRELSPPWNHGGPADPWRFSDDTHLNYYHVLEPNRNSFRQRIRREYSSRVQDSGNINLYTPVTETVTPARIPQPPWQPPWQPPPQPEANPVKQKTKRVYRHVAIDDGERSSGSGTGKILPPETESSEKNGGREKRRARSSEPKKILLPVTDLDPDPGLTTPVSPLTDRKKVDHNVTNDFFSSFYHKKKKKRQRDQSVDNLATLLHNSRSLPVPPLVPKATVAARGVRDVSRATITRVAPFITDKAGAAMMPAGFNGVDDSSSGGDSPMKNIPPPPPLPPFKMPDWKFTVEGDFVRLQSTGSSRSVSPDGDEARSPSSDVDTVMTTMTTTTTVFCPSPDVDTKADSFIARFRAGLKLERMSKLGPGPGSSPSDF